MLKVTVIYCIPSIIDTVSNKSKTFIRRLLEVFLFFILIFYIIYASALFVQLRLFKILISPTPQVLIISSLVLILISLIWALIAKKQGLIKKSRLVPVVIIASLFVSLFCFIFTLTIQSTAQISESDEVIKITSYNRLYETEDNDTPAAYMKTIDSDIISLQEASTPDYTKTFAEKVGHQYYIQAPDNDTGLVSRWPITETEVLQNGSKQVIRAEIATDQGNIAVYAVHITPPFTESMYREGLVELKQLSEWIAEDELPVIVGGDLNTTIYSPEMRTFTSSLASKIKPTTEQRWPQCSWYGHGRLQCLRIDFVFIPTSSLFADSEISPDLGSDHRAITVQFSL